MIKETVTCENIFTGEEETVDLYFHLTEAELTLLDLSSNNKYSSYKEGTNYSNEENIKMFQKLISTAYGEKTEKGQFVKNDEIRDAFLCSPAFSVFLTKIVNGEININEFILGCLPKNISKKMSIVDGKPVINIEEKK